MDKKLLEMFRTQLGLDIKALPDSISVEDFNKLIEKSAGKLFIKPEDFKNLQKTVSQKDVDLKKIQDEFDKLKTEKDSKKSDSEKKLDAMGETIKNLTDTISTMNKTQDSERLAKEYPDILPELLQGRSTDEIERIVDKQREVNKKLYGDSQHFAPADYSDEAQVDEAIEDVKNDKTKNGENSAVALLHLERTKDSLSE